MIIGGIRKTTLIDYPGRIASMIFTVGCTFACPWCHNGGLLDQGDGLDEEDIFDFLRRRRKIIDGLVISGGEPTVHEDLPRFISEVRKMGLLIKLDTNGSLPDRLEPLLDKKLVDYVAMDVKAPLEDYATVAGVGGFEDAIVRSIEMIMKKARDYEFRTTFVPGLHDESSAEGIGQMVKGAKVHYLQYFRPVGTILDPEYRDKRRCTEEELDRYSDIIGRYVEKAVCRI
ncbi:MAG: anaerobic ribonucleoside-triphosphate reductase activating protein [Synergistota bacterium]|nr:anaerobic ribonucleoside-triphosphate reductase activating protein [Synergistota bacterium]